MEPTSAVFGVPFTKNPRPGQAAVFRKIVDEHPNYLNISMPTGYGKTFIGCGSYAIAKTQGRVNRMLMICTSDAQVQQFKHGGHDDLLGAGVSNAKVIDVGYFGTEAIKKHRNNDAEVYVTTVQGMLGSGGDIVRTLMASGGRWMVCVDEYHHYGIDKAWGRTVLGLPSAFTLAMSATPTRTKNDSAFGGPDIAVRYREAAEEGSVKRLCGHSYIYRLDLLDSEGGVESVTTDELVERAGGSSPESLESFLITRKMRWSPKYVSPLVSVPLERMLRDRIATGYRLQAIIGAMCVSHAEMVCKQVEAMFGDDLTVNWVGTGNDGRKPEENRKILQHFCPPKDPTTGKRNHTLDVLVHVGIAGEGLDAVDVSEIVFLTPANLNNRNLQHAGRGARVLVGVTANINFDSASEFAQLGYTGDRIMDAMDFAPPEGDGEEPGELVDELDYAELPDEPTIQIHNMELDHIDSGSPEVVRMKKFLANNVRQFDVADIDNPESAIHHAAVKMYREMRRQEAEELNDESRTRQWNESAQNALRAVTGLALRKLFGTKRVEGRVAGDIKKRINTKKMRVLGPISRDIEVCREHYLWLKDLESTLLSDEIPRWLQ
jgi:type I site-specific restriction endonuclease